MTVLRYAGIAVFLGFLSTPATAEFAVDMGERQILQRLEILTLQDLSEGQSGTFPTFTDFCVEEGKLFVFGRQTEEVQASEYGGLRIEIVPGGKAKIDVVTGATGDPSVRTVLDEVFQNIANFNCSVDRQHFINSHMIEVDSIQGAKSISELLDLYAGMN
ncbi:MAG: hypothetical protein ACPGO3_08885 [Magnetospiraceae bacterium]